MGILVSLIDRLFTGLYQNITPPDVDQDDQHPLLDRDSLDSPIIDPRPNSPLSRSTSPPLLSPTPSRPPGAAFNHPSLLSPSSVPSSPLDTPPSPPPESVTSTVSSSPFVFQDTPTSSSTPTAPSPSPPPDDPRAGPPGLHIVIPSPDEPEPPPNPDAIPSPDNLDLSFDDEGLSTLEKIYLFSRSQANFHKVFITHAMPSILPQVSAVEAVEYVLPLLNGLAMDEDEGVKEALATELVPIIWWFSSNCRLTDDEMADPTEDPTPLLVQAFTPILGTLLLSPSAPVGAAARLAIVEILRRVRDADAQVANVDSGIEIFGVHERRLLEQEILQQVVIGIGRLDIPDEGEDVPMDVDAQVISHELDGGSDHESHPASGHRPRSPPAHLPLPISPPLLATIVDVSPDFTPPELTPDAATLSPPSPPSPIPPPQPFRIASPASKSGNDTVEIAADTVAEDWIPPETRQPVVDGPPDGSLSLLGAEVGLGASDETVHLSSGVDEATSMDVNTSDDEDMVDAEAGEQAAVGRLSSMSLMAAVSASGYLEDSTKAAFVREVERVSRDPVYWVRKEASYALGALAKVVPVEVVHIALLPLFDSLSTDSVWNVRHSALFALPAILSRLSPQERRTLALRTILPLANDSSLAVRLRVLEALGEVIYSFRDDPGGPPDPVLRLFLGKFSSPVPQSSPLPEPVHSPERPPGDEPEDPSFDEPARPLICAFNLPAVALTLGHERWGELRPLYEFLAQCEAMKVRRTLAASVGEMARIVGPMHAARDMFPMWRAAMGAPEVEVRLKAVGALESLIGALASEERPGVLSIVEERWDTRALGWKEREALAGGLVGLVIQVGEPLSGRVSALVRRALEDEVAAVREAGVRSLPIMYQVLTGARHVWEQLSADVREMAHSSIFRRRMTFVACYQALLTANGYQMIVEDSPYRYCLAQLSEDPIIDVRIGVARLVGTIYNQFIRSGLSFPQPLDEILQRLQADAAPGVRAYVPAVPTQDFGAFPDSFATFSRPPPTPAAPPGLGDYGMHAAVRRMDGVPWGPEVGRPAAPAAMEEKSAEGALAQVAGGNLPVPA